MTEQELAAKFTKPDETVLKIRKALLKRIEGAKQSAAKAPSSSESGLIVAAYIVRDLIDSQGKVLLEDLEGV